MWIEIEAVRIPVHPQTICMLRAKFFFEQHINDTIRRFALLALMETHLLRFIPAASGRCRVDSQRVDFAHA